MPYRWRSGRICPCTICRSGLNKIPDKVTDRQALFVGDVLATGYWAAGISEITEETGADHWSLYRYLSVMLKKIRKRIIMCEKDEKRMHLSGNIIRKFLQFRRKKFLILFRQTPSMVERMLFLKLQEQNYSSVLHGNAARPNAIVTVVALLR